VHPPLRSYRLGKGHRHGAGTGRDLRRPDWVDEAPDLSHDYQLEDHLSVADLMSRNLVTVHTYDDLARACELINQHGFGALPVLDKGNHLVGIVSKADLFVVIGTSLNVYPAAGLIHYTRKDTPVYLIDPNPADVLINRELIVIPRGAGEGLRELIQRLTGKTTYTDQEA